MPHDGVPRARVVIFVTTCYTRRTMCAALPHWIGTQPMTAPAPPRPLPAWTLQDLMLQALASPAFELPPLLMLPSLALPPLSLPTTMVRSLNGLTVTCSVGAGMTAVGGRIASANIDRLVDAHNDTASTNILAGASVGWVSAMGWGSLGSNILGILQRLPVNHLFLTHADHDHLDAIGTGIQGVDPFVRRNDFWRAVGALEDWRYVSWLGSRPREQLLADVLLAPHHGHRRSGAHVERRVSRRARAEIARAFSPPAWAGAQLPHFEIDIEAIAAKVAQLLRDLAHFTIVARHVRVMVGEAQSLYDDVRRHVVKIGLSPPSCMQMRIKATASMPSPPFIACKKSGGQNDDQIFRRQRFGTGVPYRRRPPLSHRCCREGSAAHVAARVNVASRLSGGARRHASAQGVRFRRRLLSGPCQRTLVGGLSVGASRLLWGTPRRKSPPPEQEKTASPEEVKVL